MSRSRIRLFVAPVASLLALSCGESSPKNEAITPPEQWSRLAEGSWELAPGQEDPRWCKKIVLTEDIYVSALRPVHPLGTHHTTLALIADDGTSSCTGSMFGAGMIYAAGTGTGELHMPKGVAMKLPKGQALILNLHIYNATGAALSGLSGIDIVRAKPEDITSEADILLSGPTNFALPPGQETTLSHTCKVSGDETLFTLFPHMHQLGVHIKTTVNVGDISTVLHDGDYRFEEQYQLPVGPVAMHAGDSISTECTYQNTTPNTVRFGESSDTEMCFSILFRYPRGKSTFCNGAEEGSGGMPQDGGKPTAPGIPCAQIGDLGNDQGVGKYCTQGGGQCQGVSGAPLCLADYAQGAFANFCTTQCQSDDGCGTGAFCSASKICVPTRCVPDAGTSSDQ